MEKILFHLLSFLPPPPLPVSFLPCGTWQRGPWGQGPHLPVCGGRGMAFSLGYLAGCVRDPYKPLKPLPQVQLDAAWQSAWTGHVTLVCPSGWTAKSLFLSVSFYGWLASSVIIKAD